MAEGLILFDTVDLGSGYQLNGLQELQSEPLFCQAFSTDGSVRSVHLHAAGW